MSASQAPTSPVQLVAQGIAAYKVGDLTLARAALTEALQLEPDLEAGWLWLSGVVTDAAERRYCLERVVALNPAHTAAQRGLAKFPADLVARSPLPVHKPTEPVGSHAEVVMRCLARH
jgi:hypothetical protein